MSYERFVTFLCDHGFDCPETIATGYTSLRDARIHAKAQGWIYRDGLDHCPNHQVVVDK